MRTCRIRFAIRLTSPFMRTLILSDIHANQVALETVLAEATGQWDRLWFLGDLVGYGPDPNECVDLLRSLDPLALSGNHDWAVLDKIDTEEFNPEAMKAVVWTKQTLNKDNEAYLDTLPPRWIEGDFTLAHASPRHPVWEYIIDLQTALENFDHFDTTYCLVGHSHVPSLFELDTEAAVLNGFMVGAGEVIELSRHRLILNPGSVGQPRDGDPRAAYALLDNESMTCTFHRVAYDVAETQRRMKTQNLPRRLIDRLDQGV
jgi:diadenosine tetraphosphatase ApaH/serine/threonine PP2A family protein phosphatase